MIEKNRLLLAERFFWFAIFETFHFFSTDDFYTRKAATSTKYETVAE